MNEQKGIPISSADMVPQWEATETWAAWACPAPMYCPLDHCSRCGEHVGGQGHASTGFYFAGQWRSFGKAIGIVFSCDEVAMTNAMRAKYGDEYWVDDAIKQERVRFFPDRRARRSQ